MQSYASSVPHSYFSFKQVHSQQSPSSYRHHGLLFTSSHQPSPIQSETHSVSHDKKSLNTDKPDWALMNEIGTIYKTGSFPFLQPDDLTAICVFRCCGMCPCPHASSLAISKNMDTRLNPLDKADRAGDVIDPSYAHRVIKAADEYIRNAPDEIFVNNIHSKEQHIPEWGELRTPWPFSCFSPFSPSSSRLVRFRGGNVR